MAAPGHPHLVRCGVLPHRNGAKKGRTDRRREADRIGLDRLAASLGGEFERPGIGLALFGPSAGTMMFQKGPRSFAAQMDKGVRRPGFLDFSPGDATPFLLLDFLNVG
jgi:hypothetical protein